MMDYVLGDLWHGDLFVLYRKLLFVFCTIYTVTRLSQAAVRWARYLAFPDRSRRMLRSYLFVQVLRTRWRRFWVEYIRIAALLGIISFIVWLHRFVMPVDK